MYELYANKESVTVPILSATHILNRTIGHLFAPHEPGIYVSHEFTPIVPSASGLSWKTPDGTILKFESIDLDYLVGCRYGDIVDSITHKIVIPLRLIDRSIISNVPTLPIVAVRVITYWLLSEAVILNPRSDLIPHSHNFSNDFTAYLKDVDPNDLTLRSYIGDAIETAMGLNYKTVMKFIKNDPYYIFNISITGDSLTIGKSMDVLAARWLMHEESLRSDGDDYV